MTLLKLFKQTHPQTKNILIEGGDAFFNNYLAQNYAQQLQFKDFEFITVDCNEDGIDELIATLTESSLFGERKLVVVKNPFFLTPKVAAKFKKKIKQLEKIIDHLNELDDIIIFVANYDKLDRRKKITKCLINQVNVINTALKPYEISGVIKAISKEEGFQFTNRALQILLQRSDQVLDSVLSNYIKLKNICDTDHRITETLVEQNIDRSLSENIFEILSTAFKGNIAQAIQRLNDHLLEGNNVVQLIAIFESQIEFLLCVKTLENRKWSKDQITKELGANPYRVKFAMQNRVSLSKLKKLMTQIIELDFNYKMGNYHGDEFLKLFLLNI
ncbi:DNA polymerase III subunit delta [Lactobacillus sp.]|uniref:DNA polymerase III subunit delta n=1 Tax=Lactobacillus sp. TaxID=1591 RepID=UPI0019CF1C2E|nr:DNA polymerase III subunit delta [Lactobacillus sp.]MBD5430085.1 DNA polymerase III subunit delta [Lactobacillus sp.]MBD5430565.1 DNA polymerase III subunit delta [Lactobacillus sp.]